MKWINCVDELPPIEVDVEIIDIDNIEHTGAWHIGNGRFLAGDIVFESHEVVKWLGK